MARKSQSKKPPQKSAEDLLVEILAYGYIYHDLKKQERAAIKAGDTATVKHCNALIVDLQIEQRILNEKRLKLLKKAKVAA